MGQLLFCDLCSKTVDERDMRVVKLEDIDGKPRMSTLDICTICAEKIKAYIRDKEWLKS